MSQAQTYQRVLQQLSQLPASRMDEVREFLDKMLLQKKEKPVRSFAGIWSDMPEEDFQDLLDDMRKNREALNKEFDERSLG
ncbi:hypothetical protein [Telluribacter sp.]|uniref:hypothetical protein n=1 Tax=Telluribacter sp. TaxID=1978767 RepID=UPI002E15E536|nr:hypothetical protein [Telluribacter sp.]